jgi:hypothetical protein
MSLHPDFYLWALGIGNWAWGIGHWALGMGHWVTTRVTPTVSPRPRVSLSPCLPCPPSALCPVTYGVHTSIGRKGFNRLIPHKSPNFGQLEILFLPLILELGQRN